MLEKVKLDSGSFKVVDKKIYIGSAVLQYNELYAYKPDDTLIRIVGDTIENFTDCYCVNLTNTYNNLNKVGLILMDEIHTYAGIKMLIDHKISETIKGMKFIITQSLDISKVNNYKKIIGNLYHLRILWDLNNKQ